MRSVILRADAAGAIRGLGLAGQGLVVIPNGRGACFPITIKLDRGQRGSLALANSHVLWPGAFNTFDLEGAVQGSEWNVIALDDGEDFRPASSRQRKTRIIQDEGTVVLQDAAASDLGFAIGPNAREFTAYIAGAGVNVELWVKYAEGGEQMESTTGLLGGALVPAARWGFSELIVESTETRPVTVTRSIREGSKRLYLLASGAGATAAITLTEEVG